MRIGWGMALAGVLLLNSCGDDGKPSVLQELDATLAGLPVHVTYDNASRVCTTVSNGTPVCQSIQLHRDSMREPRLDREVDTLYVLRLVVPSGTVFDGLPTEVMRMSAGLDTDLVMAVYDAGPACFHETEPDGQTHTVTVMPTQVDAGTGVTAAAAATENAC